MIFVCVSFLAWVSMPCLQVFVANPRKTPGVMKVLTANKLRLIQYLRQFHNDKAGMDVGVWALCPHCDPPQRSPDVPRVACLLLVFPLLFCFDLLSFSVLGGALRFVAVCDPGRRRAVRG